MIYHTYRRWGNKLITTTGVVLLGLSLSSVAAAAPPHAVTYKGNPVTTAVPGKPFTVSFHVKNTSTDTFSGVSVIFHIPDGLTVSKVAPNDATIEDDTITWSNLTMTSGQSLYPAFTFTLDSGTPLKTKKSIWVEVKGTDMEATSTNFSVTAVKTASTTTSSLSSTDIASMFQSVYGRTATASEHAYWLGRRSDKPSRTPLLGAMGYHKFHNIAH